MARFVSESLGKLDEAETDAACMRIVVLKTAGWTYTCETPGAVWLWQKTLPDGRTLLVSEATALDFVRHETTPAADGDCDPSPSDPLPRLTFEPNRILSRGPDAADRP